MDIQTKALDFIIIFGFPILNFELIAAVYCVISLFT